MFKKYFITFVISFLITTSIVQAKQKPPFLILGGIPHYTMTIKQNWDNKELNLTKEQKAELLKIRKDTISGIVSAKKKIAALKSQVLKKIEMKTELKEFDTILNKIASHKIEATKLHLSCVYRTKKVLNKKQLEVIDSL